MNNQSDPMGRGRKAVYYAFLVAPVIYIALIFEIKYLVGWEPLFQFNEAFYLSLIYAFAILALTKPLKNSIWQKRKASIHTQEELYTAFFSVSMVSMAMAESIGVIAILIYMLSGDLLLPIGLNLLAMFAVYINIPKQGEIDERIREFHFEG
jgi:hypothetical protein